jgi:hypothetical protein
MSSVEWAEFGMLLDKLFLVNYMPVDIGRGGCLCMPKYCRRDLQVGA